eukprot:scaffold1620_cov124-Skeletonema_menzelii.AAC.8
MDYLNDHAAILAAAKKKNNYKKWLKAEMKFRNQCLEYDIPYPIPTIDTGENDKVRRSRARREMRRAIVLKYFPNTTKKPPILKLETSSSTLTTTVPPPLPPTAPISSIPPTTEPTSSIPTATTAPVSFVPQATTSADQPAKERPCKTADELKAGIYNDLNKKPPVLVVGCNYVRQRIIKEQQPLLSSPPSPPSPILQQPQQQSPSKSRKKSPQLDQPRRQSLRIQQQHQQQQQQQQGCINQAKRGGVCWMHEAKRSSSDESTAFGSEFDMTTVPLQSTTDSLHERSTIGVPREVVVCREIVEV